MGRISVLSKAKGTESIDLDREKGELGAAVKQREIDAGKFINHVYVTFKGDTINEYVTSIESLGVVKEKIE
jgi:hypothetical protein